MDISQDLKKQLENTYQSFLHDERILRMKDIPMHRGSNCYIHSFRVAKIAIKRSLRHKNVELLTVLLSAILHDYYLYDWRVDRSKMKHHMSSHPFISAQNAKKDFAISETVQRTIESHMWPVNFTHFPKSKEARIVSHADKTIYLKEICCSEKFKKKHEQIYLKKISKLFD